MIDGLKHLSVRLRWLRWILALCGVIAVGTLVAELFYDLEPNRPDAWLIPAAVLCLWNIVGLTMLNTFSHVPLIDLDAGLMTRLKARVIRAIYYLVATLFIALSITSLYVTYKVVSIWWR